MQYQGEEIVNVRFAAGTEREHHDEVSRAAITIRDQAPDFTGAADPFALFASWLAEAEKTEPDDPNAMALATVDAAGQPNLRMILLKGSDERGFVFYTNSQSAKGLELAEAPKAALLFYWKSLHRQVRVRGPVETVSDRRGRRLFRHTLAGKPHRRLGLATIPASSRAAGSRGSGGPRTAEFAGRDVPRPPTGMATG